MAAASATGSRRTKAAAGVVDLGGRAPPEEAVAGAVGLGLGADHAPGAEAEEI